MTTLAQSLKVAMRQFWHNPGFTLTVIVTLALSIGANTAIFSVVNTLLLKSLPYPEPERIATAYTRMTGPVVSDERHGLNGEQWELLRDNVPAVMAAALSGQAAGVNLLTGTHIQYVHDGRVSAHYFDVLGIKPFAGRNFSEDEDRLHGPEAAILSYSLWRDTFGANREILGRTILLKGEPYTVVGILAAGTITPLNADLYTPLHPQRRGEGNGTNYECIVRLREGATWQQADAQISSAWLARSNRYEELENPGVRLSYHFVPLQKAQTATLGPQVLALMIAAGFILLIACANLAGLALVRMMRRTPEVAMRLALGASAWQIQKQFWLENLLLAVVGGAAGLGVGLLGLRGVLLLLPHRLLPVADIPLDGRVMTFTMVAALATSILFGMLPALASWKVDLRSSLAGRTVTGGGRLRLRQVLIAGEMALTVVLLAASGLLIRSLVHLETLPPGFNSNGVVVAKASLDDARFHDAAAFRRLLAESTAAMRAIPGVQNAAAGLSLPYERTVNDIVKISDGKEAGHQDGSDVVYVTPGYFETLQMQLLAGRVITQADRENTQKVAVVNQAFARHFYGGGNPVGRFVDKDTMIVGEVADVSVSSGLYDGAPLMSEQTMYIPATQVDPSLLALVHVWFQPDWIVRQARPLEGLTAAMQAALNRGDANVPVSGFYSMNDLMARTLATQRTEVALLGTMAGLALLLSAIGISALVANLVAQRTREVGIRMALGSTVGGAMMQIGRSGVAASGVGLAVGLVLCVGALRVMQSVLYGVGVYDLETIVGVVGILAAMTMVATTVPALRIARIDPAKTLREE